MAAPASLRVGRRTVAVSSPDKVLFPRARVTKLDLAHHYMRVAPLMLPHLADRPLALQAFPGGIEGPGHYMKNAPRHFPEWIERATVDKRGGTVDHVVARDTATLVYLAGQNVVTLHSWLSRAGAPRKPDRLIFDFDPTTGRFADVRAAAREAGERLRDAGLVPYPMATGSSGLHVICPLRPRADFAEVHAFARAMAEEMVKASPRLLTLEWLKADRGAKIYVDVNRNAYAQHAAAPYAVRAKPKAPVAMPLYWEELSSSRLRPDGFTIAAAGERVSAEGDPWKGFGRHARSLP